MIRLLARLAPWLSLVAAVLLLIAAVAQQHRIDALIGVGQ